VLEQAIQITGAVLVLVAFAAVQTNRLDPKDVRYLVLNIVGSGVLGVIAIMNRDFGFILLEIVWAAVAAWGLIRREPARKQDGSVEHG
jgi:hypothetical protein